MRFLSWKHRIVFFFFFSSFLLGCHHDLQPSADGQESSQLSFSCTAIHAAFGQASPDGGLSFTGALASARVLLAAVKKLLSVAAF